MSVENGGGLCSGTPILGPWESAGTKLSQFPNLLKGELLQILASYLAESLGSECRWHPLVYQCGKL